jgi:hypothetical protein
MLSAAVLINTTPWASATHSQIVVVGGLRIWVSENRGTRTFARLPQKKIQEKLETLSVCDSDHRSSVAGSSCATERGSCRHRSRPCQRARRGEISGRRSLKRAERCSCLALGRIACRPERRFSRAGDCLASLFSCRRVPPCPSLIKMETARETSRRLSPGRAVARHRCPRRCSS